MQKRLMTSETEQEDVMTTRRPKPSFMYTFEAPQPWLQVAVAAPQEDIATLCRRKWQCCQATDTEPPGVRLRMRLH
jgi:hypothetical protein